MPKPIDQDEKVLSQDEQALLDAVQKGVAEVVEQKMVK